MRIYSNTGFCIFKILSNLWSKAFTRFLTKEILPLKGVWSKISPSLLGTACCTKFLLSLDAAVSMVMLSLLCIIYICYMTASTSAYCLWSLNGIILRIFHLFFFSLVFSCWIWQRGLYLIFSSSIIKVRSFFVHCRLSAGGVLCLPIFRSLYNFSSLLMLLLL